MLNLPQNTLTKIKNYLLRQQTQVQEQLKTLDKEDPVLADSLAEASEPGTESFEADVHSRLSAIKNDLMSLLKSTTSSLNQLSKGTYGVCQKCGKQIETQRLEAMPTAAVCISCSRGGTTTTSTSKKSKKR